MFDTLVEKFKSSFGARIIQSPRALYRLYRRHPKRILGLFLFIAHVTGALTSVGVVMSDRSPQGAAAWAISLNTFPYVAVPAYWIFGHNNFDGYKSARRTALEDGNYHYQKWLTALPSQGLTSQAVDDRFAVLSPLAGMPFTTGNNVDLVTDAATFDALFEALEKAESYILVQYFILRDDRVGTKLRDRLIAKSRDGVRVYLLYDEVGSVFLEDDYIRTLREAGVSVTPFSSNLEGVTDFRLNFRNHRKIFIVDGLTAITGGSNVGDEYLGEDPEIGHWRDTNVILSGPIVQALQVPFVEDWRWATGEHIADLRWEAVPAEQGMTAICMPSGPATKMATCVMSFHALVASAQERLWIATPYFVPDEQIVVALQLAALRGVDVRILMPETPDSKLVYLSTFTYLDAMEKAGIKVYRYTKGFLHQKVLLVDDDFAVVGTANFDYRSFRLNFEVNIGVYDEVFAGKVADMLENDFSHSIPATAQDFRDRNFFFRLAAHISRLMAPIQ